MNERMQAQESLARGWPQGVCRYCRRSDDEVDGDRVRWVTRSRNVCNGRACLTQLAAAVDRALAERRERNRKRSPAEIHELKMQELRERRKASRERSRKKRAA